MNCENVKKSKQLGIKVGKHIRLTNHVVVSIMRKIMHTKGFEMSTYYKVGQEWKVSHSSPPPSQ